VVLQAAHFSVSFQGLGEAGLKILSKVRAAHGFGIITEAIDSESLDLVEEYADVHSDRREHAEFFFAQARRPRQKAVPSSAYVRPRSTNFSCRTSFGGQLNVMLCERGVRTFSDFSRNTLDLGRVPA